MTPKQQRFVNEYLIDLSATQAAIRAGYSEKTAHSQGPRLLENVEVKAAIEKALAEREKRTEITQDWVLTTIYETAERCKQTVPVLDHDGEPTGEFTFQANAVLRAAELAGRHLGMFDDRLKVDQTVREQSATASDHNLAILEKLRKAGAA
jgi:phage terminase small subunit